jgi:hypothetical protein
MYSRANLSSVDAKMADGTFGKVTSALGSRQLQLGLRVAFLCLSKLLTPE